MGSARRLAGMAAVFLSSLLAACGGGGGGAGAPPPIQQLQLNTALINFASASTGGSPAPAQLSGSVSGNPTAVYATVLFTNNGILGVSTPQVSGASATAQVTAKPGVFLQPGTYHDTITVKACPDTACTTQFTGSPAIVNVTYAVGLDISPAALAVNTVEGAVVPGQALNATYYAGSGSWSTTVTYTSGSGWLTVPASGSSLPAVITSAFGPLKPGTYSATIGVTASAAGSVAETRSIPVTYVVKPLLNVAAVATFSVTNTMPLAGQSHTVAVTSNDPARNTAWTATVDPASPWLQLTSASGTTGGTSSLTIALDAAQIAMLRNGSYAGSVTVTPSLTGTTPIIVPIALTLDRTQVATVAPYVEPSGTSNQVYLRGAHFDSVSIQAVQFGSVNATSFQVDGPTRIRATHPALTAGQYPVSLVIGGAASLDTTATLFVQDPMSYVAAGSAAVPVAFPQFAEFDPERHACYVASTTKVGALQAGASGWTAVTSATTFTNIFGMALTADGRDLLVGDGNVIVHLNPSTLVETSRATLTAPSLSLNFGGLARVDDGTVAFAAGSGAIWAYTPWQHHDAQLFTPSAAAQSVQSNRTGNQLVVNFQFGGTNYSIFDSMSLTQSLSFAETSFGNFYAFASDRFGARWAFTQLGTSPTILTDGAGTQIGTVPATEASANALSDDGQAFVVLQTFPTTDYLSYDLSAVAGGGAASLKGSVSGSFDSNDQHAYLTPQQTEVVTCGFKTASAAVLP